MNRNQLFKSSLRVKAQDRLCHAGVTCFVPPITPVQISHFCFFRLGPCVVVVLSWRGIYLETVQPIRHPLVVHHWTV